MILPAGKAENQGLFVHVYDFGMEQFRQITQFNPVFRRDVPDFNQGQVIADEWLVIENDDFDDID